MIRPWLSQNDVLNHTNVKAFITHGGTLSTFESTYHGVPTIGIPFIVDQFRVQSSSLPTSPLFHHYMQFFSYSQNVQRTVELGCGEFLEYPTLTTEALKQKLLQVLTQPQYARNATIRSQRFRDQPEKPIDRAIWWIEYVLRNGNLSHLQSPVMQLRFVSGNSLDLYAILLIAALIVVGLVGYLVCWLYFVLNSNACTQAKVKVN